jgi:hypothetical protein
MAGSQRRSFDFAGWNMDVSVKIGCWLLASGFWSQFFITICARARPGLDVRVKVRQTFIPV